MKNIAIIGGGFAGWYTAASIRNHYPDIDLTIIDSDKHPRLGVGETLGWSAPYDWKKNLGVADDRMLMWRTGAIYKYGINVSDFWHDDRTFSYGKFFNLKIASLAKFYGEFDYPEFYEPWSRRRGDIGIQQAWMSINQHTTKNFDDYIAEVNESGHFVATPSAPYDADNRYILRPSDGYSYHIDAEQTVGFIKDLVLAPGGRARHRCSAVINGNRKPDGDLESIELEDGSVIRADLFIDASGFSRVLMKYAANESWINVGDEYCDGAWVCPTRYLDPEKEISGGTDIFGEDHGWRFRVKLYHRAGQGYIFNSRMVDPELPRKKLMDLTEGRRLVEPRLIRWDPGYYSLPWQNNVLLLGISANFIDPYDAPTFDIHGRALEDLVRVIGLPTEQARQEFNAAQKLVAEERHLRLIFNFGLSRRKGEFWQSRREMAQKNDYMQRLRSIIHETSPIESRLRHFWHQMYYRMIIACDYDRTGFQTIDLPEDERKMAEQFFAYNRARNEYISRRPWPNYYLWLKENRFNGETHQQVLERLNPKWAQ